MVRTRYLLLLGLVCLCLGYALATGDTSESSAVAEATSLTEKPGNTFGHLMRKIKRKAKRASKKARNAGGHKAKKASKNKKKTKKALSNQKKALKHVGEYAEKKTKEFRKLATHYYKKRNDRGARATAHAAHTSAVTAATDAANAIFSKHTEHCKATCSAKAQKVYDEGIRQLDLDHDPVAAELEADKEAKMMKAVSSGVASTVKGLTPKKAEKLAKKAARKAAKKARKALKKASGRSSKGGKKGKKHHTKLSKRARNYFKRLYHKCVPGTLGDDCRAQVKAKRKAFRKRIAEKRRQKHLESRQLEAQAKQVKKAAKARLIKLRNKQAAKNPVAALNAAKPIPGAPAAAVPHFFLETEVELTKADADVDAESESEADIEAAELEHAGLEEAVDAELDTAIGQASEELLESFIEAYAEEGVVKPDSELDKFINTWSNNAKKFVHNTFKQGEHAIGATGVGKVHKGKHGKGGAHGKGKGGKHSRHSKLNKQSGRYSGHKNPLHGFVSNNVYHEVVDPVDQEGAKTMSAKDLAKEGLGAMLRRGGKAVLAKFLRSKHVKNSLSDGGASIVTNLTQTNRIQQDESAKLSVALGKFKRHGVGKALKALKGKGKRAKHMQNLSKQTKRALAEKLKEELNHQGRRYFQKLAADYKQGRLGGKIHKLRKDRRKRAEKKATAKGHHCPAGPQGKKCRKARFARRARKICPKGHAGKACRKAVKTGKCPKGKKGKKCRKALRKVKCPEGKQGKKCRKAKRRALKNKGAKGNARGDKPGQWAGKDTPKKGAAGAVAKGLKKAAKILVKKAKRAVSSAARARRQQKSATHAAIKRVRGQTDDMRKAIRETIAAQQDGENGCDCSSYIEAAKLRIELERARREKAEADNMVKTFDHSLNSAASAADTAKSLEHQRTTALAAARSKAKADAQHLLESMNLPADQKLEVEKKMVAEMTHNAEEAAKKTLPDPTAAETLGQKNLDHSMGKLKVATDAASDLRSRIRALKAAMNSAETRNVIQVNTEAAMRSYLMSSEKQRKLEEARKPEVISQWVPFDAVSREKDYKYHAMFEKPSYLTILKKADVVDTEANVLHGQMLTFLEDDQIKRMEAKAAAKAEKAAKAALAAMKRQ